MKTSPLTRIIFIFVILIVCIGADQVTKSIVRTRLGEYQIISLLHNHLTIEKVENSGAFLSLGDSVSKPVRIIFLNLVPLLLILASLGYILIKPKLNILTVFAISLMIGGGIGNIYDRIVYGSVTDFLYLSVKSLHTGVFNIADLCITIGIAIILLQSWLKKRPSVALQNNTDLLKITFREVYGFPNDTFTTGGYNTKSLAEIKCGNFSVKSLIHVTTAELYRFYEELVKCNEESKGTVNFGNHEHNLSLKLEFNADGNVTVNGTFKEQNSSANSLHFHFISDRSFIQSTIKQLHAIADVYGNAEGVKQNLTLSKLSSQ